MILAPLRGVTIRCFRETFADEIRAAGFTEAITPFITATPGFDPLRDPELLPQPPTPNLQPPTPNLQPSTPNLQPSTPNLQPSTFNLQPHLKLTPQFIGKDPAALRQCLMRIKSAGYDTADLNCGCPFPMVRNKGRGSGLLRTPDVLRRMLEVGCDVMGAGKFSVKTRLGVDRNDELLALMPLINEFPLRFLTVHARTARQMYEGACDHAAFARIAAISRLPLVYNGDIEVGSWRLAVGSGNNGGIKNPLFNLQPSTSNLFPNLMIGRSFIRHLGEAENTDELLLRYLDASERELSGDRPVLGRIKELIAYWKDLPAWRRRWNVIKLTRTAAELRAVLL